jgi:hypothetical protein
MATAHQEAIGAQDVAAAVASDPLGRDPLSEGTIPPEVLASINKHADVAGKIAAQLITKWGGDVLSLSNITEGHALYFVAMAIFEHHDLLTTFAIDPTTMRNFLLRIESGYGVAAAWLNPPTPPNPRAPPHS